MKPLRDIRVVDFTMGWSGPLATRHLADMGAEVIKVEACQYADWWRGWEHTEETLARMAHETTAAFNLMNRNKLGITLDLTREKGRALVLKLVARADAVIENQAQPVMPKLGLGYSDLVKVNPAIVMLSMPGFGSTGPWAGYRGYGSTVEHGAGLPHLTGESDGPPVQTHIAYGDACGGFNAAAALLVGILHRKRTGEGQFINLAQVECMLQLGIHGPIHQALTGEAPPRTGNRHPVHAPSGIYACAGDDSWLTIAVTDDAEWRALAGAIDRRDLATDARFATAAGRRSCHDEIDAVIADWARSQDARVTADRLQAAGVPAAPVLRSDELGGDPHLNGRGFWVELERAHVGRKPHSTSPYLIDGARGALEWPTPTIGEHNDAVLGGILGLSEAELRDLADENIIGTVPFVPKAAQRG
ncbi:MAG: CoA transferase [Minwuia sp.]|nr:CoA transferase [Minwuia sp.]